MSIFGYIALISGFIAVLVLAAVTIVADLHKTPAQRAGFADPPPVCVKGELPKRIYLSGGDVAFTCRIP